MTARPRRQQHAKPGEPRFTWPQASALPVLKADPAPLAWSGTLTLNSGRHVAGILRGGDGWTLDLQGNATTAVRLDLRATILTRGLLAMACEDWGLSYELVEAGQHGCWRFAVERGADGWAGAIVGRGWALQITGTSDGPGCLRLLAHCAAASQGAERG